MYNTLKISCIAALFFFASCEKKSNYELKTGTSGKYTYEYVENDPLKVRIFP
jgi:hypothetical protein